MKYFDTHAHLNFPDYDKDRDVLIKKTLKEGVFIINIGTDFEESNKVIAIADEYGEGVYASVGLHPIYIKKNGGGNFDYQEYKELGQKEKVVAIGEIGLDYKYIKENGKEEIAEVKKMQKEAFISQIDLAEELNLPIIIHSRMAHQETIEILRKRKVKGVVHCFSGNRSDAKEYLEMGLYLGINGIIFKMNLEKVIQEIPLDRILLETDCPFLSPIKEEKRNEPLFIKRIAQEVAKIKNISLEEVEEKTTKNGEDLFLKKD